MESSLRFKDLTCILLHVVRKFGMWIALHILSVRARSIHQGTAGTAIATIAAIAIGHSYNKPRPKQLPIQQLPIAIEFHALLRQ